MLLIVINGEMLCSSQAQGNYSLVALLVVCNVDPLFALNLVVPACACKSLVCLCLLIRLLLATTF